MVALRRLRATAARSAVPAVSGLWLLTACGSPAMPVMMEPAPLSDQRPAGVALCYSSAADQHAATQAFWRAVWADDRGSRAAVIQGLDAAVAMNPKEEELRVLLGLANLWRVADPLPAEAKDQAVFIQSALAAKDSVEQAYKLCPSDYRLPAWLGPILVNMGRAVQNPDTVKQGMQVLQEGIDHYPSFVLFSKLLIFADRPRADPDFQQALQALQDNTSACGDPATSRDPACRNTAHAAHNIEGSMVFLGDVYTKAGLRDKALRLFQDAQRSPGYASWSYQGLITDRIKDLDARLAALGDDDASNDPDVAWRAGYQCAVCHKR